MMVMESDDDGEHSGNPSCLMRYRSAPSSFFSDFLDDSARIDYTDHLHPPSPSPEIDSILARFISSDSSSSTRFNHLQTCPISVSEHPKLECRASPIRPPLPHHGCAAASTPSDMRSAGSSILVRHSSSPAQLFSHANAEPGASDQLSFSDGHLSSPLSSSAMCAIGVAGVEQRSGRDESGGGNGKCYFSGYPMTSWSCSEKMNSLNGWEENGINSGQGLQKPSTELGYLRLPSSAVPCITRAKRGCATHPRSIAERVRRTRISERMRKLEDLVPNMEKQMSTADMLDLAVEYIKELQQKVKTLSDEAARCTCGRNEAY